MEQPNPQQYRYLANLLNTNDQILDMIAFIQSNRTQYPANVNQPNYLIKSQRFNVINNNLVYVPFNLRYVLQNDVNQILNQAYNDPTQSLGRGVDSFYKYIRSRYLGINRRQVAEFLKTKKSYNLSRPKKQEPKYSLPVYTSPKQMYAIDLIDMGEFNNGTYKYIVNCMDLFSKYVFLAPLRRKTAANLRNFFQNRIINQGFAPNAIMSDNGKEFTAGFATLLADNDIRHIFNPPYNPIKPIEAMNGNVRRLLRDFFIRNRSVAWHLQLGTIQNSLNNYYSRRNGQYTPAQIFNTPVGDPVNPIIANVRRQIRAEKTHPRTLDPKFEVNQAVHVSLIALDSNVTKANKERRLKKITVIWTPQLFQVNRVIAPQRDIGHYKYIIRDEEGRILGNSRGGERKFLESDLIDASTEIQPENELEYEVMMERLNKITNPRDFVFVDNE